jgi:hypothetical protein
VSRKLEEKQRRRQAEERRRREQRRAAVRRNLLTGIIIFVVAAVVIALIVNERRKENAPVGVDAQEANCGDIETFEDEGNNHVDVGVNVDYKTTPPTSGNHYGQTAPQGFYAPGTAADIPEEHFVHNLEHGEIVIWYQPSLPAEVRDDLEAYINRPSSDNALLALSYDQAPAPLTLTAWGAMQQCDGLSEEVIDAFRERFQGKGPEAGVGPPPFSGSSDT